MEDENISEEYIKAFNQGYIITQNMPEHSEAFAKALGNSERAVGFKDGQRQAVLDQKEMRYPAWLKSDRLSDINKNFINNKDKRKDIEPEI